MNTDNSSPAEPAPAQPAHAEHGQVCDNPETALLQVLTQLLAGEMAGARVAREFAEQVADADLAQELLRIARDEAWCCAMLKRHVESRGGFAPCEPGPFYQQALALESLAERLAFLDRGQAWVIRRLDRLIEEIGDESLAEDLRHMNALHKHNIGRCSPPPESQSAH